MTMATGPGIEKRADTPRRILLLGATGTIGRAALGELISRGYDVTALVRPGTPNGSAPRPAGDGRLRCVYADLLDIDGLVKRQLSGLRFDAILSCLASRTGVPDDAWAIDYQVHRDLLMQAGVLGVEHFVLLSAICVQRPRLAFQRAKLAFEQDLRQSEVTHSIVRPTAFFKSLSGQVERVKAGKPFLVFGDGRLTACKPIGDEDLAVYLADCLEDPDRYNRTLPIGGPGPAITPLEQAEMLFALLDRPVATRRVPVALLRTICAGLGAAGRVHGALRAKAELARIGLYYATESMLVWNEARGCYDADLTPGFGSRTLEDHYRRLISGETAADLRDHAVF
ncbi:epimerase [Roseibium aquae]|uniref:Divinyl chlorophyllide a 8-vinyl-reductase, chloroplastic n=1 Tax=Roseibium aquae TaxID=1323746 RepID=A0A916TK52_9HYPH|nr:epimerase [Roseibium aquae]